ncbi:MAG: DEAD/DEAH box helicase [Bacteroidota bacterium]
MTFKELDLLEPILNALHTQGYTSPTPIQEQAIPIVLKGKDIMGCAQTGTGKTAAFAIPILQRLQTTKNPDQKRVIRALIVTPTRELAIQIDESFKDYGKNLKLQCAVIFGGVNQTSQVNRLRAGVDILVATPGRLLDLVGQRHINLRNLEIFVLDEADRMLDMGFIHDVKKIIKLIPEKRQTLFFSATMPKEITSLANSILTNPSHVEVTPVSSTAETIQQEMYFVDTENKKNLLIEVLNSNNIETALVFTRTKHGADKLVKILNRNQIKSEAIHGNKSQNARQNALNNFKNKTLRVLVATDIAARGIDIDQLEFVVNYDIPNIPETYVHRIGRTGRAGASGKAVSFCNTEEQAYVKDIQKLIGLTIPVVSNHSFPATGKVAEKKEQAPRFKKRFPERKKDNSRV